jgi:hypothetical protein
MSNQRSGGAAFGRSPRSSCRSTISVSHAVALGPLRVYRGSLLSPYETKTPGDRYGSRNETLLHRPLHVSGYACVLTRLPMPEAPSS